MSKIMRQLAAEGRAAREKAAALPVVREVATAPSIEGPWTVVGVDVGDPKGDESAAYPWPYNTPVNPAPTPAPDYEFFLPISEDA